MIHLHLKNIFEDEELIEDRVVKDYLTTAVDGKRYQTKYYNLETIIAVGYRVRSKRGTQFRRWATERLNEYLVKGFTMDDERLKQVSNVGSDYFLVNFEFFKLKRHDLKTSIFYYPEKWPTVKAEN